MIWELFKAVLWIAGIVLVMAWRKKRKARKDLLRGLVVVVGIGVAASSQASGFGPCVSACDGTTTAPRMCISMSGYGVYEVGEDGDFQNPSCSRIEERQAVSQGTASATGMVPYSITLTYPSTRPDGSGANGADIVTASICRDGYWVPDGQGGATWAWGNVWCSTARQISAEGNAANVRTVPIWDDMKAMAGDFREGGRYFVRVVLYNTWTGAALAHVDSDTLTLGYLAKGSENCGSGCWTSALLDALAAGTSGGGSGGSGGTGGTGGTGGSSGGGTVTLDDMNGQNVNKDSWWSDLFKTLFVPSVDQVNAAKAGMTDFVNWGPFSLMSQLQMQGTTPTAEPSGWKLPGMTAGGGMVADLGPQIDVKSWTNNTYGITFVRAAMGAMVYLAFAMFLMKLLMPKQVV